MPKSTLQIPFISAILNSWFLWMYTFSMQCVYVTLGNFKEKNSIIHIADSINLLANYHDHYPA